MEFRSSPATRAAGLPFSDAVKVGDVLYLSGHVGNLPGKLELAPGGIEAETRQMMDNIWRTLAANGLALEDVFKCTVMLADMKDFWTFNKIYMTYFNPDRLPARTGFGVAGLALGARVEMECWASAGGK